MLTTYAAAMEQPFVLNGLLVPSGPDALEDFIRDLDMTASSKQTYVCTLAQPSRRELSPLHWSPTAVVQDDHKAERRGCEKTTCASDLGIYQLVELGIMIILIRGMTPGHC